MAELMQKEVYGAPVWEWTAGVVIGGIAVGGGIWLLYEYYVAPGQGILDQYKEILKDIYLETKQFLVNNDAQGIKGLTASQEAILAAKQVAADKLRPDVEKILYQRGTDVWVWVETAIIGIIAVFAVKELGPALIDMVKKWRAMKPEASTEMMSQYGHGDLIFNIVANEFALAGRLDIASAFYYANIPSMYSTYIAPALSNQIVYYNEILLLLGPGTIEFLVAQQMLRYMTYEASSVTGIMAVMYSWWLPPLI